MSRRLLAAALLALAACCARGARAAPLAIAVSRTPLSLPLYVAEAEGYFAEAGLSLRIVDCTGGHRCHGMASRCACLHGAAVIRPNPPERSRGYHWRAICLTRPQNSHRGVAQELE